MRLNSLFTKMAVLSGVGVLAFGATAAQASPYTINLTTLTPLAGGGATYTYTVNLTSTEQLVAGDFISLFDFGTFTNAVSSLAGFDFTNPNLSPIALAGPNPGLAQPPPVGADDAAMGNLVANYSGAAVQGVSFTISANSPFAGTRADFSYGQTTDNTVAAGGAVGKVATTTPVSVPTQAQVIPEPGTVALALSGLLPVAGAVIRRRRRN